VLYGVLSWLTFVMVSAPLAAFLVLIPTEARRRAATRRAARLFLALSGVGPKVFGLERLPDEPCIVVANHASYLDGVVLMAVLPPRFSFVIKREVTRLPVLHFLLRRIGSQFVERFDTRRGASDARRILSLARARTSLVFFPEGTFRPEPGLRRFQNGAFAAAVRGNAPVVPVVLRGTRAMLSSAMWLPRHTRLEVIVKPALRHNGEDGASARLLEASRSSILEDLPEPDLLAQHAPMEPAA